MTKNARVVLTLLVVSLSGCWWNASLPGTIAYNRKKDRAIQALQQQAANARDSSEVWQKRFVACAHVYGRTNANRNLTAIEVGEAAASSCDEEMNTFIRFAHAALAPIVDESVSPGVAAELEVRAWANAKAMGRELSLLGKQAAIRGVLEGRAR